MINIFTENEKILQTKEYIKSAYLSDNRPWVVGFSGGKDSTAVVQLIFESMQELEPYQRAKPISVISSDTLVETPMIINMLDQQLAKIQQHALRDQLPITAHKVKPKITETFWVNLLGKGYPLPRQTFRWCTDRMKIKPSNTFILDKISEHGEVIMVLGVREGESASRTKSIQQHTIDGSHLMKHSTLKNAFTFTPIRTWSTDDVWEYLLDNPSPWGGDNHALLKLYQDSDADCPLVVDKSIGKISCGNSRFGCWVCTVVQEDKSLTGFINNGEDWLLPLLEYRNYLMKIRDDRFKRQKCRRNGRYYLSKNKKLLDTIDPSKAIKIKESEFDDYVKQVNLRHIEDFPLLIETDDGEIKTIGLGPYTLKARKELFEKLLNIQNELQNQGHQIQLILPEEIEEIHSVWEHDQRRWGIVWG